MATAPQVDAYLHIGIGQARIANNSRAAIDNL